jgi:hypothetical protein
MAMYHRLARFANVGKRPTTDCAIRPLLAFTSVTCNSDPSPHRLAQIVNVLRSDRCKRQSSRSAAVIPSGKNGLRIENRARGRPRDVTGD